MTETHLCSKCGAMHPDDSDACPTCGHAEHLPPLAADDRSKREESAKRAIRSGMKAAIVLGAISAAVVSYAIYTGSESLGYYNDPFFFFDIILVFACAFGLYRRSRAAAVILTCHYVVSIAARTLDTGQVSWIAVVIFMYYFLKAVRGTFAYHSIQREGNPEYRAASRWAYFVIPPVALVLLLLVGFGFMSIVGVVPSTGVVAGTAIRQADRDWLVESNIVAPGEKVLLFYSAGLTSISEDGNILTDQRVVSYETIDGRLEVYAAEYRRIKSIEFGDEGGLLSDAVIVVNTVDGGMFELLVSTEGGGDMKFFDTLTGKINGSRDTMVLNRKRI